MSFWSVTLAVLIFIGALFKDWLYIFISPVKKPDIFWIMIPVWISWFFAEFFQEKKGTSFGNAISNGVIPLFVGIDWGRYITYQLVAKTITLNYITGFKYVLCAAVIIYGFSIIVLGIRAKHFVRYYGRIREVTYILVMFSPIVYGIIAFNWRFILSIFLFFPLYYYLIEIIDKLIPTPKIYEYDESKVDGSRRSSNLTNFNTGLPPSNLTNFQNFNRPKF